MRNFVTRFLIVVLVVGGLVWYFGGHYLNDLKREREAVLNAKKEDINITLIEGKRREEYALSFEQKGITKASDFISASAGLEGKLFPDTYRFYKDTDAKTVVNTLVANFEKRTRNLELTQDQLILASIIEREADRDDQREAIAGIYQNRLDAGMKLQADPTVQYGKDNISLNSGELANFWQNITQAEYSSVQSPYNTYQIVGLPPTPICNPGLKSIEAAVNPQEHDYYFFVIRDHQLLMSKTYQEHLTK